MTPGDYNDFLAFGIEFWWDLLLVLCAVRWLLGVLLVLLDGLVSQSWFHGSQSWFPWSQLWFISPRGKCSKIAKVVVKQSKVGFTEINYDICETNFGFFNFLSGNVEDWVDQFSSFSVVSLSPVISNSSLSENEVVWSEELSELPYWIIILILIYFQGWSR